MTMKITKQLAPQSVINKKTSGKGNSKKFIVIHETANLSKTAGAQAHANLQKNMNSRDASWHYQVDDKLIIQSFEDDIKCWHAGSANSQSIAIEICVNSGSDFKKAVKNAEELVKHLMKKHNISVLNVKQHNYFTGKNCPTFLRNGSRGINWSTFISNLTAKPKPVAPSKPIETIRPILPTKPLGGTNMKMSELLSASQMKQMEAAYKKAYEQGKLSSDEWYKKVANKTIMLHEVAYLSAVLFDRYN